MTRAWLEMWAAVHARAREEKRAGLWPEPSLRLRDCYPRNQTLARLTEAVSREQEEYQWPSF